MGIVAAVGVSANTLATNKERSERVQEAMRVALLSACAEGLRVNEDAAEIKARMLAARDRELGA